MVAHPIIDSTEEIEKILLYSKKSNWALIISIISLIIASVSLIIQL